MINQRSYVTKNGFITNVTFKNTRGLFLTVTYFSHLWEKKPSTYCFQEPAFDRNTCLQIFIFPLLCQYGTKFTKKRVLWSEKDYIK